MGDVVVVDFNTKKVVPRATDVAPTSLATVLANRANAVRPEKALPPLLTAAHRIIAACEDLRDSAEDKHPPVVRSLARIFLKEFEAAIAKLGPRA